MQLLGERRDVSALLAAADIYCQPNDRPGAFGLSFVEALVAGLPVVSTTLGAVSEIVDDPRPASLVAPHEPGQVASALESLFDDDQRRAMSAAARARGTRFTDVGARVAALAELLGPVRQTLALQ